MRLRRIVILLPRHSQLQSTLTKYVTAGRSRVFLTVTQEVKLTNSANERDLYDSLAEVYSIIITLEALEKAYLKDSVAATYYTDTCGRLLQQYKSNLGDETVSKAFGDLERFKSEWNVRLRQQEYDVII